MFKGQPWRVITFDQGEIEPIALLPGKRRRGLPNEAPTSIDRISIGGSWRSTRRQIDAVHLPAQCLPWAISWGCRGEIKKMKNRLSLNLPDPASSIPNEMSPSSIVCYPPMGRYPLGIAL